MTISFTHEETWYGGFYELALELGAPSDERLLTALQALWAFLPLEGCYLDRHVEPSAQPRLTPSPALLQHTHLQGIAQLPNSCRVACGTCVIREEDGSDWLDFYLPLGALSGAYDLGGYPFDDRRHDHWQRPVDAWLARLGYHVFAAIPFELGLIGMEVSGITSAAELAQAGIPDRREIGYLWRQRHTLTYAPRNA